MSTGLASFLDFSFSFNVSLLQRLLLQCSAVAGHGDAAAAMPVVGVRGRRGQRHGKVVNCMLFAPYFSFYESVPSSTPPTL